MACHGVIGGNVVTDFGYGSANFLTNQKFFAGGVRNAFNDADVDGGIGGWQSLTVNGTVSVPAATIPAAESQTLFGSSTALNFAEVMGLSNIPNSGNLSMEEGITPASGQPAVSSYSSITITYPSAAEILALLPSALQANPVAVSAINVAGLSTSQMTGLAADASGTFVRNGSDTVTCQGDVVVKGPLFLNNLKLATDSNGCRLYVSSTVFIQGPVTYTNGAGGNLQITSALGVMMGLSAERMSGATSGGRTNNSNLTTAGGPWPRFALSEDGEFNPGGQPINGIASGTFFDTLVSDARLLGMELLDAGDPAAVSNLVTGETTVTEPASSANAGVGGPRVAINYTGLLLNAPHVHSRYGGTFQGVIIGDVVMLARNPSQLQLEQFSYDPVFDKVQTVLPALTTQILKLTK